LKERESVRESVRERERESSERRITRKEANRRESYKSKEGRAFLIIIKEKIYRALNSREYTMLPAFSRNFNIA
jgi:hypothetical protein